MSDENADVGGEQEQESSVSPEVIREAELLGWVPKEKFRGSEDDWIDAEVFVKRGKEINPILRKNNELLLNKLNAKDSEIAEIKAAVDEFRKYHAETEERAYKRALSDLKAAKKEALETGDHEAVVEIDDEIADLKESKKTEVATSTEPTKQTPVTDPVYVSWESENRWIVDEPALARAAEQAAELLRIRGETTTGRVFLDKVTDKVKEAFPEKFGNTNRDRASPVEGSRPAAKSGKRGYADLPAEAKVACDRFVKQGLMTKDQYVADFDWN